MKGFGDMGNIMKQAQQMQKKIGKIQEELNERVVDATAGGNMVKALVNGQKELLKIEIDPEVLDPEDVEMLEDLIVAAVNQAMKKAEELREKEMSKATGGMMGGAGNPFSGMF